MMTMTTYTVTATREDGWWVLLADLGTRTIATQAKRLDQADEMAREAIALALDVAEDSFALDIQPQVDDDLRAAIKDVHDLSQAADAAQAAASESRRAVVRTLKARGFTVRDSGKLLRLSSQRISQLLSE
jgi:predicted RNase H-like HicB family nuclease